MTFNRIMRYPHLQVLSNWKMNYFFTSVRRPRVNFKNFMVFLQVRLLDFSPSEKFLVTYSSHEPSNPRDTQVII